jgi:opacity protein-like surface antigen
MEEVMKKVIALFAILLLVSSLSFGQEFVSGQAAGSKGLLFEFSGLNFLNANAYQGGIGMKLFMSDYTAVRGIVRFVLASETIPANPAIGQGSIDGTRTANEFGVGAALEIHLTKGRVSPYIGGGVFFGLASTDSKNPVTGTGTLIQPETKNAGTGETINGITYYGGSMIQVGVLIGVEYYVTNGISLSAEYQLGFTSMAQKDEEITASGITLTTKNPSTSEIGITTAGALTLAVYF